LRGYKMSFESNNWKLYTNQMWDDDVLKFNVDKSLYGAADEVNSPAHYTRGTQEAIDIIEDVIKDAPTPVEGMLHAQTLKYLLRMWLKGKTKQDAEKARWYLNRLIDSL